MTAGVKMYQQTWVQVASGFSAVSVKPCMPSFLQRLLMSFMTEFRGEYSDSKAAQGSIASGPDSQRALHLGRNGKELF